MNCQQLRTLIVIPTLSYLGLCVPFRENILLGTAATESNLGEFIAQVNGPALGIWQQEPATKSDIQNNYLLNNRILDQRINELLISSPHFSEEEEMIGNFYYSCAMAFMSYWRHESFRNYKGADDDVDAMANFYKQYYNSSLGSGSVQKFKDDYARLVTEDNS